MRSWWGNFGAGEAGCGGGGDEIRVQVWRRENYGHRWYAGKCATGLRRELEAAEDRDDRSVLPASRGCECADRGNRRCDGGTGETGQGEDAGNVGGESGDAAAGGKSASDRGAAERAFAVVPRARDEWSD